MRKSQKKDNTTIALLIIAALIVFVIVTGTILAFAGGHVRIRSEGGRSLFSGSARDPDVAAVLREDTSGTTAVFTGLGTIRVPVGDDRPVTLVITAYFPYPVRDLAFEEELTGKTRAIRRVILEWFASRKLEEIVSLGEKQVKAALIEEINNLLVLGSIEYLYFSDYLVLD